MDVGLGVSEDLTLAAQAGVAREVEAAGLRSLWTNEASGRDALALCQAWGESTERIEVGVGVVPIWTRSPAQLAMAAAALQEATAGRFLLGLGVSHPVTMGAWHGAEVTKPRTAASEYLDILRALTSGGTTDHRGEVFSSRRFRLQISPLPPPVPTYLAAMGPRMLEQAGASATGVLLNWSSPDEVRDAAARARAAAAGEFEVAAYVRVAVDEDREAARRALAREVGRYCALPAYAAHFERQGLGELVTLAKEAHKRGGEAAVVEALPEALLLDVGWFGTPGDDPAGALARYAAAGLDHLVARVVVVEDARRSIRAALGALERVTAG